MNPAPFLYQFVGGWAVIQGKVDQWARDRGYPTYGERSVLYRFDGWGVVGFWPPRLACNVKYFPEDGSGVVDAGRFTA